MSPLQKKILQQLGPIVLQQHFYLVGGTTIALYLGHRHSVDLDWFTRESLTDPMLLAQEIRDQGIPFIKICQNTPQLCWGDEWPPSPLGGEG